jgi:UDP-2-acetamido-3-amino-2,3-dideoxy-glucuronate N-acetyltransferase
MTDYFVHESSYVDEGAVIGAGTRIWHFCHIMPGAVIGERCNLGQNVVDDVFCGPSCVFTNVSNPRSHVSRKDAYRATLVRRGSSIGANATIVCGVILGQYCFVGAGAVVTSDVPDYALMVGVPARRVGWMCRCGERLPAGKGELRCQACGEGYREVGNQLRAIDPAPDTR